MKSVGITLLFAVLGTALAATATAANSAFWTTQKAERAVVRSALVRLPASERAANDEDLARGLLLFGSLATAAVEMGDVRTAMAYDELATRYASALRTLRMGLAIEQARCTGSGRAPRAGRFARFRCAVVSEALSLPSTRVHPAAPGELPLVAEGPSRTIGPLQAELDVRVTGPSRMTSSEVLAQTTSSPTLVGIE